jgi:hypothetical protein
MSNNQKSNAIKPRRHGGLLKRKMENKDEFDIETWDPNKITHRGVFFTVVVIINVVSIVAVLAYLGYGLLSVSLYIKDKGMISANATLMVIQLISLCFLWFRFKWAAIVYLIAALLHASLAAMAGGSIFIVIQGLFHVTTVGFAVFTRWRPKFIPNHLRERYGYGDESKNKGISE